MEYGFKQSIGMVSTWGEPFTKPYADDVEEYITRFTPDSLDACRTVHSP